MSDAFHRIPSIGVVETRPLSRIKRISGPHLHRSWVVVPHVTHQDEADVTELEDMRQQSLEDYGDRLVPALRRALSQVSTLMELDDLDNRTEGRTEGRDEPPAVGPEPAAEPAESTPEPDPSSPAPPADRDFGSGLGSSPSLPPTGPGCRACQTAKSLG